MNQGAFLVVSLDLRDSDQEYEWLCSDGLPYEAIDPIDFLDGLDIIAVYEMYRAQYSEIDNALNIQMPDALLEFNRWILFRDDSNAVVAFACFKTTGRGLKLGALASTGSEDTRPALKSLLRAGLNVEGVYAEVSDGVERTVAGRVPEVDPAEIETVLTKPCTLDEDGRHYIRDISNVGPKRKLLVGRPYINDTTDPPK